MTAEIAILNKLAVALATDSAVTISAGRTEEKIYDSGDKLFELSYCNPIGIMIYNGLQFMQAPLPMIISEYRSQCGSFATVKEAAYDFLRYLHEWGLNSSDAVMGGEIKQLVFPVLEAMQSRISKKMEEAVQNEDYEEALKRIKAIPSEVVSSLDAFFKRFPKASFIGGKTIRFTKAREEKLREYIREYMAPPEDLLDRLVAISKNILERQYVSSSHTGIVIAGFGSTEKFPSLISFTIDGLIFDRLKYSEVDYVDIDRDGDRASVLPFAQKEMVERFLYGLDSEIERQITVYCKQTVPEIRNQIIKQLDMSDDDLTALKHLAQDAERAFLDDLQKKRFEEIRSSSRAAIEGMVEFMPKPEMAKMAEALVNLTSIKRRVSRGMETVGGPIDVAVISRSEGFIWVKRKHYFSADLNPRYVSRVKRPKEQNKGKGNGSA